MNFFCSSSAFNQKYQAANFFRLIAAKSGRNKSSQKTVQKSLSHCKIMRKLQSVEEKGLLTQYHMKQIQNKVAKFNIAY